MTIASAQAVRYFRSSTFENCPTHLKRDQTLSESTGYLRSGASASQEMKDEQHETYDEGNVNEPSGNVKCKKSQQPKNNENCGD